MLVQCQIKAISRKVSESIMTQNSLKNNKVYGANIPWTRQQKIKILFLCLPSLAALSSLMINCPDGRRSSQQEMWSILDSRTRTGMEIFQYLVSVLEEDFKVVTVILNTLGGTTSHFIIIVLSSWELHISMWRSDPTQSRRPAPPDIWK